MKYIEVDNNGKVIRELHKPFDEKYGVVKSEEDKTQMEEVGFFVEDIPIKENKEGFRSDLYYIDESFEVRFTKIENKDEEVTKLQNQIDVLSKALEDTINLVMEG